MKLNSYLKNARLKAGLSQRDISSKLGYSTPQFVSSWERGLVGIPHEHMKELAKILGVPLKKLIALSLRDYREKLVEQIGA